MGRARSQMDVRYKDCPVAVHAIECRRMLRVRKLHAQPIGDSDGRSMTADWATQHRSSFVQEPAERADEIVNGERLGEIGIGTYLQCIVAILRSSARR